MKSLLSNNQLSWWLLIAATLLLQVSCKDFIEVGTPKSQIISKTVFITDASASSAISGIYSAMTNNFDFTTGTYTSITNLMGLSSDEMENYSLLSDIAPFFSNSVLPTNSLISRAWLGPYKGIYYCNSLLEGLNTSTNLTPTVRSQLEGEAKFIRAFCYFYLVNLFGQIPITLTTDYHKNSVLKSSTENIVYEQIIGDLQSAKLLLAEDYQFSNGERVRPNKWAATALLARVYLYNEDWINAEREATEVLGKTNLFNLTPLASTFKKNSLEAIFQLMGTSTSSNTSEGLLFILTAKPQYSALRNEFVADAFEEGDMRRTIWINSISDESNKYYFPFKYKLRVGTVPLEEYYMVLRLAEQYLIRAEARVHQHHIAEGIADINVLRVRARALATLAMPNPLPDLPITLTQSEALLAIEQERKVEFFAEWGHRWFDLKRTKRANQVLSGLSGKSWQPTDVLFPIPQSEIEKNINLKIK